MEHRTDKGIIQHFESHQWPYWHITSIVVEDKGEGGVHALKPWIFHWPRHLKEQNLQLKAVYVSASKNLSWLLQQ